MILLTASTDLIGVITAQSTTSILVHASWIDNVSGTITPGRTNTPAINGTVASPGTTVVAGPSSGQRNVKTLTVFNSSASSNTITVVHSDGTNVETLFKYTLLAGELIQYYDTLGFQVADATGSLKLAPGTGRFNKRTVYTSGNTTHAMDTATKSYIVEVLGAGGGGGGAVGNSGNNTCGGGGGASSYTSKRYSVGTATTFTYGVGAGGVAGNAGNNGSTGGLTSFTDATTQINGAGGLGGVTSIAGSNATAIVNEGGAGGGANANGDINGAGAPGCPGIQVPTNVMTSGSGGSTYLGQGGVGYKVAGSNGINAVGFGGGGGGAVGNTAGNNGGTGGGGVVIITEYT